MSYLSNLNENGDDEVQDEIPIDRNFHLVIPNDIFIDLASATINSSENVAEEEGGDVDPLGDLGGTEFQDVQTPHAMTTATAVSSEQLVPPEKKIITPLDFQNISIFNSKMKEDIEGIIKESVHLVQKDPREYHAYYLRVLKYLTIGQNLGHLPQGEAEGLKFWEKYDLMAANQWNKYQKHPTPFSGEASPYYAHYISGKKVNNKVQLIPEKRTSEERNRHFNELERKARKILRESSFSSSCDIKSNLDLRLKFLSECCIMTNPEDCRRMSTLWTKFCNNFGKQTTKLHEGVHGETPHNSKESSTNHQRIVLRVQVGSPRSDLGLPSFGSPPPSPSGEEVEEKCVIPLESDQSSNTKDATERVTLTKPKVKAHLRQDGKAVPEKKRKAKLTPVNPKAKKCVQKRIKIVKENKSSCKVSKKQLMARLKKSKLIQSQLSLARKVSKKTYMQTLLKHDKVLSILEKKINNITKKLKNTKPLSRTGSVKLNSQQSQLPPAVATEAVASAEFSICEDCGQTYRTQYLSVHKEAVHNPNNLGKSCLLCPMFFKKGPNLWSHFLTAHMPNHLNPTSIAMQVEPVVEEKETFKEHPENSTNKQTVETEESGPSEFEKDKSSWDCPHCNGKPFATKASLQRHLHLVHGEGNLPDNKLVCSECPKSFKEKAALTQHVKSFHQGIVNVCEVCEKRFQTPGKLWKHRVDHHGIISEVPTTNRASVQCENCGENCLQGKQFINHVRNKHPEMLDEVLRQEKERRKEKAKELKKIRIQKRKQSGIKSSKGGGARINRTCPKCGKVLKHGGLSRHLILTHGMGGLGTGIVKTYRCPHENCEKEYKTRINLRIHISESHDPLNEKITQQQLIKPHFSEGGTKASQCALCGWVATRVECMMHIVLAHPHCFKEEGVAGDSSVKCPHCEETGQDSNQIRNHVELVHSENFWRCPYPGCNMIILSPVDLQEHFFKDHGENVVEEGGKRILKIGASKSKRNRSNWKKNRRKAKGEDRHAFRRRHGAFPCYRCKTVEPSANLLDRHVKKEHPEAYWPCKACGVVCFSERSKLFHQSVLCKVKRQKITTKNGVVGYDKMIMECPICKRKIKAHWLSKHLNEVHGLIEDGDLWKCDYCKEDEQRQNFRTREYWLAHMDDCHGGEVNMEALIEVAGKINSKEVVDVEKISKSKQRKWKGTPKQAVQRGTKSCSTSKRGKVRGEIKSRSGRIIKRKRAYSDESDSDDDDESVELRLSTSDDDEEIQVPKRKIETRTSRRLNALKMSKVASDVRASFDLKKIMSNVPLKIQKMFDKQCSVRVKRLTMAEIELKRRNLSIKTEADQ